MYEKVADATTALYVIVLSSLKSSILMSMRSPETPVTSLLSIIAFSSPARGVARRSACPIQS